MDANMVVLLALLGGAFLGNLVSSVSSSMSADPETARRYKDALVILGAFMAMMAFAYGVIQSGQLVVDNAITWFFVAYAGAGALPSYVAKKLKNVEVEVVE
jgi:hypothetical protein